MKNKKLQGNVRDAAFSILWAVENKQAYSNLLLHQTIESYGIAAKNRGLLTEITYGTLQHQMTLDYYLEPYLKGKIEPWVKTLLRLSLYQIVYLDRIPAHAVVHEAVEIAKRRGHGGVASVINGVLRSVQRNGVRSFNTISDPFEKISIETSHPEWMIRRWAEQFGLEKTREMALENNKTPAQTVRVNTARASVDEVIEMLQSEELEAVPSKLIPECLIVTNGQPARTATFEKGFITIQDESSMLPAYALQVEPGMTVLDMCAAPGGKTTHIAEKMNNSGTLYALDLHQHKVKLIDENAARLGHTVIETIVGDGKQSVERFGEEQFDRVLVDAPCSGLGVIKRKPDIKYTKKEADFARLQEIQLELLDQAARLLKEDGILVYSTCTVDAVENRGTAERFLKEHPEMEKVQAALPATMGIKHTGFVQVFPQDYGSDGFFIAAFKKTQKTAIA
ncbi:MULTISPECIES: 16S rRNA (cytosine(967)-C(5))-methyltransferase RsmB [Planococcus]|uniref:16S rRNA (cytosine(967)-C(5))-methyltransferase n=1 Tax=Planococcus faecalis TaxID=1598147 RepID=A0ABM6ITF1_9BACL|nr:MULTISPECIES: 16S rRNA (cytosine(967)-C(5))-methyltransferase RsmB [Planococcus]AQU79857.1 16S rRNA (cytosine(967)-C(5))-methyltransferase [Planococcus faecalis]MDJ0330780.1 16S rRNA (cytosine(967)-C(5))-methyltransferase RsmB [Planococcus sp. S3-L1]OHX53483.1 16S rRNA (cytosine(967)-C(5))-methyltransferase [Planococcus faecalis]